MVNSDGSVSVFGMKLGYYIMSVAKSSKVKMPIFGRMIRAEVKGVSTKKAKKYMEEEMDELSTSLVLKAFHKSTYLNSAGKGAAGSNKLLPEHIQECADFAVCQQRYLAWLKELETAEN